MTNKDKASFVFLVLMKFYYLYLVNTKFYIILVASKSERNGERFSNMTSDK